MGCNTCGEQKPKKEACAFTKATVQINNPKELALFRKVVVPASLGDDTQYPPKVGKYCNVILYYEANDQVYLYSSDGIPTRITVDITELKRQIIKVKDDLATEVENRETADQEIWTEIETIEASSDVVDVVGTYAELQAYDTSKLHDNDLIKVLQDETRDDAITYYRWNGSAFTYVGAEGPYYTATETDTLLGAKQDKIVLYASLGSYTINENDAYINTPNFSGFFRDSAQTTIVTGRELYNMFASGNSVAVHCATGTWGTLERVFDLDEGEIFGAVVFSGGGFSTDKTFRFTISESTGEPSSESVPGYNNRLIQGQMQLTAGDGVTITDRTTTSSGITHIQKVISATGGIVIYSPNIFSHRFLYSDRSMTDKITWSELSALTEQASSNGKTIYIKTPGDPDMLYEAVEFYGGDYELTVVGRDDTDFSFLHISADQDSQTYDEYIITETGIQNKLVAGSNISIAADGKTISATDTTYTHFTGATASTDGVQGLVPGPLAGDENKVLKGDGTWGTVTAAANTIFYANSAATGTTRSIYKDAAMTTAATMQEIIDANEAGQVILRTTSTVDPTTYSDAYLQNAWVTSGDYQMLFLDESKYSEYHATTTSANTFNYDSRELQSKLTAGTNVTITGTTISATDTTYSNFTGTDGQAAGAAGLVPAPATTDDGKYLKADGTWATLPGANNISSNDWSGLWQ